MLILEDQVVFNDDSTTRSEEDVTPGPCLSILSLSFQRED